MPKIITLQLSPKQAAYEKFYLARAAERMGIRQSDIALARVVKRSIDARQRMAKVNLSLEIYVDQEPQPAPLHFDYPSVERGTEVVVVGSGPAGLFASLRLIEQGYKPILLERGKSVLSRKYDIAQINRGGEINPDSNYAFGEGGAGTFSDGKLNTGTKDVRQGKVLEEFVLCGAPEEILTNGKAHIGTDKLRTVVKNLRKKIIQHGGEFRFDCCMTDLYVENNTLCGVKTTKGDIMTDTLILAIGHSARDTFKMLYSHGLNMERKSFSMGVRIEHPQSVIDEARYHSFKDKLPAADYKAAVHPKNGRGVYTFCMCPGGSVVAAASEEQSVVTNGMSNFARDGENANSALLCSLYPTDFDGDDVFGGMYFQQKLEKSAFFMAGANYKAPAQTVADFLRGEKSLSLGKVSPTYPVGVTLSELGKLFPDFMTNALREGIIEIDHKIKGFAMADAVLTGVESRSSSPVRIIRGEDMQSNIKGIYPCGEGAGYAGGIMSAAVDGIKVSEMILKK